MIISIIVCILVVTGASSGIIWVSNYKTTLPVPSNRSTAELTAAIARTKPTLVDSNKQPIFGIYDKKHISPGYYLVTIIQKNTINSLPVRVVIQDPYFDANAMGVVAGPESKFSRQDLIQAGIPTETINKVISAQ